MTPHEALTSALMMLQQEAPRRTAKIGGVDDQDKHRADVMDQIAEMVLMFEPHKGDAPTDFEKRVPHPCRCTNCGLHFNRFWLPASVDRVARMAQRGAFCPRCYTTEGIQVVWDAKAGAMPQTVEATVDEIQFEAEFGRDQTVAKLRLTVRAGRMDPLPFFKSLASKEVSRVIVTTVPDKGTPPF